MVKSQELVTEAVSIRIPASFFSGLVGLKPTREEHQLVLVLVVAGKCLLSVFALTKSIREYSCHDGRVQTVQRTCCFPNASFLRLRYLNTLQKKLLQKRF